MEPPEIPAWPIEIHRQSRNPRSPAKCRSFPPGFLPTKPLRAVGTQVARRDCCLYRTLWLDSRRRRHVRLLPVRCWATAVIGAWLLLPLYAISVSNFPDYSRITAASLGMIFGTLFFGFNHLFSFRPRWFDVPMLLWCFAGSAASLTNGLGPYDAVSKCLTAILTWGLPYFFGRIYFSDHGGLRTFMVAMVVAGLILRAALPPMKYE